MFVWEPNLKELVVTLPMSLELVGHERDSRMDHLCLSLFEQILLGGLIQQTGVEGKPFACMEEKLDGDR